MERIDYYPSIFTAEETNSIAKQMIIAIKASASTDESLLKASTSLETTNEFLTRMLNSIRKNPFTDILTNSDETRDETFLGGKYIAEGYTHYVFNENKKMAAERIVALIRRHGWSMQKFKYQDQSSATNSLLKEMQTPEYQNNLATLNLMDWYNALVKAQIDFEKIYNDKAMHESQKESVEKKKAKIPVSVDIENLVLYLNSVMVFNAEDEAWKTIYNSINGIIMEATKSSKIRRSYGKKSEDAVIEDEIIENT